MCIVAICSRGNLESSKKQKIIDNNKGVSCDTSFLVERGEKELQDTRRSENPQTSRTITQIKHFARISRLQKFVISKSQNPEIASSLRLRGAISDGFFRFEIN